MSADVSLRLDVLWYYGLYSYTYTAVTIFMIVIGNSRGSLHSPFWHFRAAYRLRPIILLKVNLANITFVIVSLLSAISIHWGWRFRWRFIQEVWICLHRQWHRLPANQVAYIQVPIRLHTENFTVLFIHLYSIWRACKN